MSIIGDEKGSFNADIRKSNADKRRFTIGGICDHLRAICGNLRSKRLFRKFRMGFTIVEIIVILAIISLVMGMAMPQFAQFGSATKLRSAVRQVVSALHIARSSSIVQRRDHTVVFDIQNRDFWVESEVGILDKKYHLIRSVNIQSTTFKDNKVTFNSRGGADARGKVTLSDKRGNLKEITVIDTTGAVRVK